MGRRRPQQGDPERRTCQCHRRRHPRRVVKTDRDGSRGFALWAEPTPSGLRRRAHPAGPAADGAGSGADGVARPRVPADELSRSFSSAASHLHVTNASPAVTRIAGQRDAITQACSLWHFAMKLVFAAPLSGLPSDPMAFGSHASRLHLARSAVRAVPASSRPSFPIALLAHVPGAFAASEPIAKTMSKTASTHRVIVSSQESVPSCRREKQRRHTFNRIAQAGAPYAPS